MAIPSQLQAYMTGLFDAGQLEQCPDEWGFTWASDRPIRRVGYATNLTVEVAREGIAQGVDLLLTHHDTWPFLYGMREACADLLHPRGISHCFFHAPLDAADFGTSAALAKRLGLRVTGKCLAYRDIFLCGRVAQPEQPLELDAVKALLTEALDEPVRAWAHNASPVQKVCIAAGGAHVTDLLKEAVDQGCDTYITGEKILYTLEYARLAGLNLLVGSHTGTELLGVEAMAQRVAEGCAVQAVRLVEEHVE